MSTSTYDTLPTEPRPIQTRYDLPTRPLDLAGARLAVANAELACALEGDMVLVRPEATTNAAAKRNARLLAWLGIRWRDASVDASRIRAEMTEGTQERGSASGRKHLSRRVLEDHALGVTRAVLSPAYRGISDVAEHMGPLLGWTPPMYLLMGRTGPPDAETPTSLGWYQEQGYLPDTLRTHLAASACWPTPPAQVDAAELHYRYHDGRLSHATWHPNLDRIQAAGRHAMREAHLARVTRLLRPRLERSYGNWHHADGSSHTPDAWLDILANTLRQEASCLSEAVDLGRFAFVDRVDTMTCEAAAAMTGPYAQAVFEKCARVLTFKELATPERARLFFEELRHHFRDAIGLRGRQVMFPIRAALTGTMIGPCLGVVASILGYDRCQRRLRETLCGLKH